jgi:hypothetical protein
LRILSSLNRERFTTMRYLLSSGEMVQRHRSYQLPPAPPLLQPSFLKGRPASGSYVMSLFPESWRGFADSLPVEEDRTDFMKMLNDCYKYSKAINAKGRPFPTEPLIMALLFSQHKLIVWLEDQIRSPGL